MVVVDWQSSAKGQRKIIAFIQRPYDGGTVDQRLVLMIGTKAVPYHPLQNKSRPLTGF